jgi:hypothetical protein
MGPLSQQENQHVREQFVGAWNDQALDIRPIQQWFCSMHETPSRFVGPSNNANLQPPISLEIP